MISKFYFSVFRRYKEKSDLAFGILMAATLIYISFYFCLGNMLTGVIYKPIVRSEEQDTSVVYISVPNVSELKKGNYSVNQYVETTGYYSAYDGGGNKFVIKEGNYVPNDGTIIKLGDGLFAVAVSDDIPTFKQFGAVGDGVTDDYDALNNALNSGNLEFNAGSGNYNLNNKSIKLNNNIKIVGDKDNRAVIKDGCFIAPYGISLYNISFIGGAHTKVPVVGRSTFEGKFECVVTPKGATSVLYDNCSFEDTEYGSFAMTSANQAYSFTSDTVNNCTFSNIKKIGVYHCVNSTKSTYTGNTFSNIGGDHTITGTVAALKLGDTTNISTIGVSDAYIYGNTFENLISGDDYSGARHVIDCNLITVGGRKATIENNVISNLIGYGNDREAVYTKVRYCSILGNTITNGGSGEGYICNKGYAASDAYTHINNNKIYGGAGVAIQSYRAAEISGNYISMTNASSAINCIGHTDLDLNRLTIVGNTIECTFDAPYYNSASRINVIQAENPSSEVHINDNIITCNLNTGRKMESIIKVGGIRKNIYVRRNKIESNIKSCGGILLCSNSTYEKNNASLYCDVSNNNVSVYGQPLSIVIQGSTGPTSRQFNIVSNELYDKTGTKVYAATVSSSKNNNDIIYYSKNKGSAKRDLYTTTQRTSIDRNSLMVSGYGK